MYVKRMFIAFTVFMAAAICYAGIQADENDFKADATQPLIDELDEIIWMEDFEGDVSDWVNHDLMADPTVWWTTDDYMAASGTYAWRPCNPDWGSHGGYDNGWIQMYQSPLVETAGRTSLDLAFNMMLMCEATVSFRDGANVLVYYGNDPDSLSWEHATAVDPAYCTTQLEAFYACGFPSVAGWTADYGHPQPYMTDFSAVNVDLSSYLGYDFVRVGITFSSGGSDCTIDYPQWFGLIVDDILLTDNNGTIWADDADGNTIGTGEFVPIGDVLGCEPDPPQWSVMEAADGFTDPPSPTMVAGINQDYRGYIHYLEYTATFDLPEINPYEKLWLDLSFNGDFESPPGYIYNQHFYHVELWNPDLNVWVDALAPDGGYIYNDPSNGAWVQQSDIQNGPWNLQPLAGMDGVKFRIMFHSPANAQPAFTHFVIDDIVVARSLDPAMASLSLFPDNTTVPSTGGQIDYNVAFASSFGGTVPGVRYWERALLPGGNRTPILFSYTFVHTPYMSASADRTLQVPGFAPEGTYTFNGYMGFGYNMPLLWDSFEFTKEAAAAGAGGEWRTYGETFEVAGEDAAADAIELPSEYVISDAYPNPFNPSTSISISLPETAELNVVVFNVMGQQVAELANGSFNAGRHALTFDASSLSSGVYFIQAIIPGHLDQVRKVVLMR